MLRYGAAAAVILALTAASTVHAAPPRPVPVIFDTDIGGDIDDTWALALLLASPEVDLKLVVTDSNDTVGKAKIAAKFLERVGRTDVAVGIGVKKSDSVGPQGAWAADYDLSKYPGTLYRDGVQAMIDMIMRAKRPITLVAVGPVPNLAEALRREPRIAKRARLIVMGGSIFRQYGDRPGRCPEYNVRHDAKAAQVAYMADWDVTMAPLDTAGIIVLSGEDYARVRDADNPLTRALIENYRVWAKRGRFGHDPNKRSSVLFDTLAVYLAFGDKFCELHDIRIRVTDNGLTVPDPKGKLVHAALMWTDLKGYYKFLSTRLARGVVEPK